MLTCHSFVFGQEWEEDENSGLPPRTILKSNPFAALKGPIPLSAEYRLGIEQVLGFHHSFVVSVSYLNQSALDLVTKVRSPQTNYRGFRAQLMYRIYTNKKTYSPSGFFIGPHASLSYMEVNEKIVGSPLRNKEYITYPNVNMLAGYQLIGGDFLALEIFTGIGIVRHIYGIRNSSGGYFNVDKYLPQFILGSGIGIVL